MLKPKHFFIIKSNSSMFLCFVEHRISITHSQCVTMPRLSDIDNCRVCAHYLPEHSVDVVSCVFVLAPRLFPGSNTLTMSLPLGNVGDSRQPLLHFISVSIYVYVCVCLYTPSLLMDIRALLISI